MSIERNTKLGSVKISKEAIATLAGGAVAECYGVVGMASQKILKDGFAELLKKDNYGKGIVVNKTDRGYELDLYIIINFGVKISEVVFEAQKRVKYELERSLDEEFGHINVFVQGIRVVD